MFRKNFFLYLPKITSFIKWLKDSEYIVTNYKHINDTTTLLSFKKPFFHTITDKISIKHSTSPHYANFTGEYIYAWRNH